MSQLYSCIYGYSSTLRTIVIYVCTPILYMIQMYTYVCHLTYTYHVYAYIGRWHTTDTWQYHIYIYGHTPTYWQTHLHTDILYVQWHVQYTYIYLYILHTDRHTYILTDTPTYWQTHLHTDGLTYILTETPTYWLTDTPTYWQTHLLYVYMCI